MKSFRSLIAGVVSGVTAAGMCAAVASAAPVPSSIPMCADVGAPRVIVGQPRTFEAVAFDDRGVMLLSDWLGNRLDVVDRPGAAPRMVAPVYAPGGIAPMPDGTVLVGSGIAAPALASPAVGVAKLIRVDPRNGHHRVYAEGLSMGNGVVRAPDGTVYASNDLTSTIDRIGTDGRVERGWYNQSPGNGLAMSADGRTLFANVSLGDTRIVAIDAATGTGRTHFRPPAGMNWTFFDDLDIDRRGRLYAPMYFGGHVLRVDTDGSHCAIAAGLTLPAGIALGRSGAGFSADSVYVTTHAGAVIEIPKAVPAV